MRKLGEIHYRTLHFVKGIFDALSGTLFLLDWTEKTQCKQTLDMDKWRSIQQLVSLNNMHLLLKVLRMVRILSL